MRLFSFLRTPIEGAVSVSVDEGSKTINISANLAFWTAGHPLNDRVVASVIAGIKAWWEAVNYGCYRVRVQIFSKICDGISSVPSNYVDIELNGFWRDDGIQSWVTVTPYIVNDPLSDDPSELGVPVRGTEDSHTTWYPVMGTYTLAHEFGHVIGLDDGYVRTFLHWPPHGVYEDLPCHTNDLMVDSGLGGVSQEMLTRLLRRHDIDPATLHCAISFDATPTSLDLILASISDLQAHASCDSYDPPSDDPKRQPRPMLFKGTVSFTGGYLAGADQAALRQFVAKLTGVDTTNLASFYPITIPVQFILPAPTCEQKGKFTPIPFSIDVGQGVTISGKYRWGRELLGRAPQSGGPPECVGPLSVNGFPTTEFYPGPRMDGVFKMISPGTSP